MTPIVRALRPVAHWLRRQPRLIGPLRRLVRSHPLLIRFGTWLIYSPLPSDNQDDAAAVAAEAIVVESVAPDEGVRLEIDVLLSRIRSELEMHEAGQR